MKPPSSGKLMQSWSLSYRPNPNQGRQVGGFDLVLGAELADSHEVAWIRNNNACFTLDWFHHERSNVWVLKRTLWKQHEYVLSNFLLNLFGNLKSHNALIFPKE